MSLSNVSRRFLRRPFITGSLNGQFSAASTVLQKYGYLTDAYQCDTAWKARLESPILKNIMPDQFFYQLDKKYSVDKIVSAIDVDLFVNKVESDDNLEEMEELVFRLRKSPSTTDTLPSTSHAFIRAYMDNGNTEDLLRILDDRINYGIFVDEYTANLLMDKLIKAEDYQNAVRVASLLVLEEESGTPVTKFLALVSCFKYFESGKFEPWIAFEEDTSEELTKKRVLNVRNPIFDDHFDLTDPQHILGKTMVHFSRLLVEDEILARSTELLGLCLFDKWDKAETKLKHFLQNNISIADEALAKISELADQRLTIIEAAPDKTLPKPKILPIPGMNIGPAELETYWSKFPRPEYAKVIPQVKALLSKCGKSASFSLLSKTEELFKKTLANKEAEDINNQTKNYEQWESLRNEELARQVARLRRHQAIENIQVKKKELRDKEDIIFFFDNEEEWMMRQPPGALDDYQVSFKYLPTNLIKPGRVMPQPKVWKKPVAK